MNDDEYLLRAPYALLISNRIKKYHYAMHKNKGTNDFTSNHLYNNLNQFFTLEHVAANCKGLKKLTFRFSGEKSDTDYADINAIVPSKNMYLLVITLNENKMLLYVVRKFPELCELVLKNWNYLQAPEDYIILLNFLSGMRVFEVNGFLIDRYFLKYTANHWSLVSICKIKNYNRASMAKHNTKKSMK